jgi:hypothetical protein
MVIDVGAHPAPPLVVTEADLEALRAVVRARTSEQRLVTRSLIREAASDRSRGP